MRKDDVIEALQMIADADFLPVVSFSAETMVNSLSFLRSMSERLGVPMDQITPKMIIDDFAVEDARMKAVTAAQKLRRNQPPS